MSTQIIVHAHDFAEDAERYQAVTGKHSVNLQIAEHGAPFIYLHARTWAELREALHTLDMKVVDQQRRERMEADEDDADRHPQGETPDIASHHYPPESSFHRHDTDAGGNCRNRDCDYNTDVTLYETYLTELGDTIVATLHCSQAIDKARSVNLDHIRRVLTVRHGGVVPQGWMIALRNLVHTGRVVRTDAPMVGLARYHLPEGVTHDAAH